MNRMQFKIRSTLIFLLFCSLSAVIIFNLYSIQIRHRDFYINLGSKQYHVTITQTPERALIYDRFNCPLVLNKRQYSAFVVPKKIKNVEKLITFLHASFPHAVQRFYDHHESTFLFIKRKLTNDDLMLLKKAALSDIYILEEPSRYYPNSALAPLIGIVDVDNNGLFGIEKVFNNQLSGTPTTYVLEKDARSKNFYFAQEVKKTGHKGDSVQLTLDSYLQFLVDEELKQTVHTLGACEGAVIIMNAINGAILAMTQYPGFDPNNTLELDIINTKLRPITDTYEPGSVIKPFVALAALQEGVATPEELIDCQLTKVGYVQGMKIGTSRAHGILSFAEVIQKSNNIGMVQVAHRLGEKLYDYLIALGFGKKTGIELLGEHEGFVNQPEKWSKRSLPSLSFGYELTVTLLQIAQVFSVFTHNGSLVQPHIVMHKAETDKKTEQLFSTHVITIMRDILAKTISPTKIRGTALEGYTIMGKTGTANIVHEGVYDTNRNVFTFAGIVEKDAYKRIIVTFIREIDQKNVLASQVTQPLFLRVAEQMIIHERMMRKI